jgi:hypothetical protein
MKRDMELIRTILLKIEDDPEFDGNYHPANATALGIVGYDHLEVVYHVAMLIEAGFLEGNS